MARIYQFSHLEQVCQRRIHVGFRYGVCGCVQIPRRSISHGGYCAAILSIARLYLLASRLSFLGLRAATTFGAGGFDVLNLSSPRLEFLLSAGVDGVNGVDVSGGLGVTVARGPESLARG